MKRFLPILLALLLIFSTSSIFAESKGLTEEELVTILDSVNMIVKEYPFPIEEGDLYEGIMKGLFQSLDEYSDFLNKEEADEMLIETSGRLTGIGATIRTNNEGYLEIIKVHENSPAEKSKLKKGDIITRVDDKDIKGMTSSESVKLIRGEKGTKVKLKVLRAKETLNFEITRDEVIINPVSYEILDGNIGYLQLSEFSMNSYIKVKNALKAFDEKNVKKLIFDLRDNGGGLLSTALSITELFVPSGKILSERTNKGTSKVYESKLPASKYELVVLVNGNSASASEIFAGAVKDRKAGVLVGEKTFGKGVIQRLYPMQDGTILKYTYAEYLTPSGISIHKKGIEPDYVVKNEMKDGEVVKDKQLEKAIELLKVKK